MSAEIEKITLGYGIYMIASQQGVMVSDDIEFGYQNKIPL